MRIVKNEPVLSVRAARRRLYYMLATPGARHVYDDAVKNGFSAEFTDAGLTVHNSDDATVEFFDKDGVFMFSKENYRVQGRALAQEDDVRIIDGLRLQIIHK